MFIIIFVITKLQKLSFNVPCFLSATRLIRQQCEQVLAHSPAAFVAMKAHEGGGYDMPVTAAG